jgi:hypothetical protein
MFGFGKDLMQQMQLMQKLMKDENFRKFMMHPKVQGLFKDPEFTEAMKNKDAAKLMSNPMIREFQADPELKELMSKLDLSQIL